MNRKIMQLRDLFAVRAHWGWWYFLLKRLRNYNPKSEWLSAIDIVLDRIEQHTQRISMQFDQRYGTETYRRLDVPVSDNAENDTIWGYCAINQDFFREILRSIPRSLSSYTFTDIGSGKGAAVLMASEFPFRRYIGIELSQELIEIAKHNCEKFNSITGNQIEPEWVHCDFFKWSIPPEPQLFFFNNPFPPMISLSAIQKLEDSLTDHGQPALLVFRNTPQVVADYLKPSKFWKPLRLAPYWQVYAFN